MLYKINISISKAKNYCENYIKNLIDKYLDIFIKYKYNNISLVKNLNENKYIINCDDEDVNNNIEEILIAIEKHIKNIYPECGSIWELNYNYELFI
jgi:hypothetical protein